MGWEVVSGDALILIFHVIRVPFNMDPRSCIHTDVINIPYIIDLLVLICHNVLCDLRICFNLNQSLNLGYLGYVMLIV